MSLSGVIDDSLFGAIDDSLFGTLRESPFVAVDDSLFVQLMTHVSVQSVIHVVVQSVNHFLVQLMIDLLRTDFMLSLHRPKQLRFALAESLATVGTGRRTNTRILRRLIVMTTPSAAKGVWMGGTSRGRLGSLLFSTRETISRPKIKLSLLSFVLLDDRTCLTKAGVTHVHLTFHLNQHS